MAEQPVVAAAPAVNGLLGVAHVEERAVRILDDFVDQITDRGPLHVAGVLELIEQPVVQVAVEPVVDV